MHLHCDEGENALKCSGEWKEECESEQNLQWNFLVMSLSFSLTKNLSSKYTILSS